MKKGLSFFIALIILLNHIPRIESEIHIYCREKESATPSVNETNYDDSSGVLDFSSNAFDEDEDNSTDVEDLDTYLVVDLLNKTDMIIECRFCEEPVNVSIPMLWYYQKLSQLDVPREYNLSMSNNMSANRVRVAKDFSLIFNPVYEKDAGIYRCLRLHAETEDYRYSYRLEPVYRLNTTIQNTTGNSTIYEKFKEMYFDNITTLLATSNDTEEFVFIRKWGVKLELDVEWSPWGICECTKKKKGLKLSIKKKGIKKRLGSCRLNSYFTYNDTEPLTPLILFFKDFESIPCRSKLLHKNYPALSNLTRHLPDFTQAEKCKHCKSKKKKKKFKYKRSFLVHEGKNLVLQCPKSTEDTIVVWRKDSKILEQGQGYSFRKKDPIHRVFRDFYFSLEIRDAGEPEAGNYTCYANNVAMLRAKVYVAMRAKIFSEELRTHLKFLTGVLMFSFVLFWIQIYRVCKNPRDYNLKPLNEILLIESLSERLLIEDDDDEFGFL